MSRELEKLELVPETLFVATNDDVKLLISMTLTFVTNVTMSIDFKDGTNWSFVLNDHATYSTAPQSYHLIPEFATFHGNYGSSCKLNAEISHRYSVEGVYCISLSVTDGTFGYTVSLQNDTCVTIENILSEVQLSVPPLVVAGEIVSLYAALPVQSASVSYHWMASCGDSDQETSASFPAGFHDSTSTVVFGMPGDCTVGVAVTNFVSSVTNSTDLTVVVPISGLTVSCHGLGLTGLYFEANVRAYCTAQIERGSNVLFEWKFDKGSREIKTTDVRTSRVHGSFSNVGRHNVSVWAKNQYNRMSSVLEINVMEAIRSVSVLVKTGLAGDPVEVSVCCKYGSNLTFVFDFGDGSQHVELQTLSTVGVAYHNYTARGMYNGSIMVYNAISNESVSFEVEVQANISNVEITIVSAAAVVGRSLVFSAVTEGKCICCLC